MPIYSYACAQCHHKFDELIKGSEKVVCPKCKSGRLKKLLTTFAVAGSTSSVPDCKIETCRSGECPNQKCPGHACNLN